MKRKSKWGDDEPGIYVVKGKNKTFQKWKPHTEAQGPGG